jgi:glycerol-3-phosphate acyltransferase PlsX
LADYKTIALDAMGGDHGPKVILPAALKALKKYKDLHIILVGREVLLKRHLKKLGALKHARISVVNATEVVEGDEAPSLALRNKKDSSMRVAINLVKEGKAQACVSAGNTGALMATARFVLKTLTGIDRPAIISTMPGREGVTHVLDLGANIDSSAEHLFQFAVMGSVLTSAVCNIEKPTVALLNIGTEDIKGHEQIKDAAQLLTDCKYINYTGYVEGNNIFHGTTDVIVCDGFSGNVALKTSEGVAKFIRHAMTKTFKKNIFNMICGIFAMPVLMGFKKEISPERYNGATLVGLNGTVIKSHGSSRAFGFYHAIEEAVIESEKNVPELIRNRVENILDKG